MSIAATTTFLIFRPVHWHFICVPLQSSWVLLWFCHPNVVWVFLSSCLVSILLCSSVFLQISIYDQLILFCILFIISIILASQLFISLYFKFTFILILVQQFSDVFYFQKHPLNIPIHFSCYSHLTRVWCHESN